MRKRYRLLAIACGALLAIALTLLLTREREPVYEDKPLSEWVWLWRLSRTDSASKRQAQEAILALCTNNLDLLARRISFEPDKSTILRLTQSIPLDSARTMLLRPLDKRFSTKGRLAQDAVEAFYAMGPAGAPAAPQLAKIVVNGGDMAPLNALNALEAIGEAAFPAIGSIITNGTTPMRVQAIYRLKRHTDSLSARNALTNALYDPDPEIRRHASDILSRGAFE